MRTDKERAGGKGVATLASTARAGHVISARCAVCGHRAEIDPQDLVPRLGAGFPIPELNGRLTCSSCGAARSDVQITSRGGMR